MTCGMYAMKSLQEGCDVPLPTCMYAVKPLDAAHLDGISLDNGWDGVLRKQDVVFSKLNSLKRDLESFAAEIGHTVCSSPQVVDTISTAKGVDVSKISSNNSSRNIQPVKIPEGITDYVVSVSEKQGSLSIPFIVELMQRRDIPVHMTSFVHSSFIGDVPSWNEKLCQLPDRSQSKIVMTLLWKNQQFLPSCMVSSWKQTSLRGDGNIARHLVRTFASDLYEEDDLDTVSAVDHWLELVAFARNGNTKDRDSFLKNMNMQLGKTKYVVGGELTLADIVALSLLVENKDTFKSVPKNVKRWVQLIAEYFPNAIDAFNCLELWCR